jgi:hypothetical protein
MNLQGGGARLDRAEHDDGRRGYQGPRVPPNLLRKSVPPTSASRRCAALTATPPAVSGTLFSMRRTYSVKEHVMTMYESIGAASDRVMKALIEGLEIEFGRPAGQALAERFLAAEEADFHWDARSRERWLGAYHAIEDEGFELDRVAVLGLLDGEWFVAVCIVDGDGKAHGLAGCRHCATKAEAEAGYVALQ